MVGGGGGGCGVQRPCATEIPGGGWGSKVKNHPGDAGGGGMGSVGIFSGSTQCE